MKKKNEKLVYWLRLLGFTLAVLYLAVISGYAWIYTTAAIRPNQHELCCGSPADFTSAYESVAFMTTDGVELMGWYIPSQNGAAVILLHGYWGNRTAMLAHAEMLAANGYGVLLYDQRATGESEGETLSAGWRDVGDVGAALEFLRGRDDLVNGQVGVLGCSTGAEIAIGAGAQFEELQAVIADGAYYTTASDAWPPYDLKDAVGWPVYPIFIQMMVWKSGTTAPMPLKDAAGQIAPRALLLIAAGEDGYEQFRAQQYFERAGEPKEIWVTDAPHCAGPVVQPLEYEDKIVDFFDRALLSGGE